MLQTISAIRMPLMETLVTQCGVPPSLSLANVQLVREHCSDNMPKLLLRGSLVDASDRPLLPQAVEQHRLLMAGIPGGSERRELEALFPAANTSPAASKELEPYYSKIADILLMGGFDLSDVTERGEPNLSIDFSTSTSTATELHWMAPPSTSIPDEVRDYVLNCHRAGYEAVQEIVDIMVGAVKVSLIRETHPWGFSYPSLHMPKSAAFEHTSKVRVHGKTTVRGDLRPHFVQYDIVNLKGLPNDILGDEFRVQSVMRTHDALESRVEKSFTSDSQQTHLSYRVNTQRGRFRFVSTTSHLAGERKHREGTSTIFNVQYSSSSLKGAKLSFIREERDSSLGNITFKFGNAGTLESISFSKRTLRDDVWNDNVIDTIASSVDQGTTIVGNDSLAAALLAYRLVGLDFTGLQLDPSTIIQRIVASAKGNEHPTEGYFDAFI